MSKVRRFKITGMENGYQIEPFIFETDHRGYIDIYLQTNCGDSVRYYEELSDLQSKRKGRKMKKNRSNSKEVKEAIKLHLIEIAQNDDVTINTIDDAIDYITQRYITEVGKYNRYNTIQEGFMYWLNGLALHTYYYTGDIIDYLHSIGLYGKNEEQENEKSADLYHYLIFRKIKNKLFNKMEDLKK